MPIDTAAIAAWVRFVTLSLRKIWRICDLMVFVDTPRTRAIVAVHFGGRPVDALGLAALASAHGGTADLTPLPGQGSALQMTFAATS